MRVLESNASKRLEICCKYFINQSDLRTFRKQIFFKIHLKCTFDVYMIEVMRFANSWFNSLIRLHHQKTTCARKIKLQNIPIKYFISI